MSMYSDRCKSFVNEPLYVITPISNSWRYHSRYSLYYDFEKHVAESGAKLMTVELALSERTFVVTQPDNPMHVQLRSPHELWHKENMINIGISRLPADWKYAAWIDADVTFARPDWVEETLQRLQHYDIVQMFSEAIDLSPTYGPMKRQMGFMSCYYDPKAERPQKFMLDPYYNGTRLGQKGPAVYWHPGFAWAIRRSAFDALGGLIDWAILGSGDYHMARCLVGLGETSIHPGIHENYANMVRRWEARAEKYIRRNVGFVPGLILHHWHGRKKDRRYWDRWKILVDNCFDPYVDLKYDWQNLWQLTDRSHELRDAIRGYFSTRHEDSIDPDPRDCNM